MKGVYARYRCPRLPPLAEVYEWVGGEFYACYHDDIRGGVLIEVAAPVVLRPPTSGSDFEWHEIHVLEFFGDAMLEAGGVYVDTDGVASDRTTAESRHPAWRRTMGFLTSVLDDIDLSHPRAVHASDYMHSYDCL